MRISSNCDDFKKFRATLARIDKNKIHSALHSALNSTASQLIPIIKSFTPVGIWAFFSLRALGPGILHVDKRGAKCRGDIKKRIKKRDRENN